MTVPALRRLPRTSTLALALLLPGCGVLDARLEAQTVCFTLSDYLVPGDPGGAGALSTDVGFDLGSDLPIVSEPGVHYSLALEHVEIAPGAGSPAVDLGGLESVDVSALPPAGSSLPAPELVHYVKGPEPHPGSITAAAAGRDDLAPYVSNGRITFRVTATGALPPRPWTADVTGCFVLGVRVEYGRRL